MATSFTIPKIAQDLARVYREAGFGLWLVGGWVRDAVMGTVHTDLDFATDAPPRDSAAVLKAWSGGRVWESGIEFGTVAARHGDIRLEVTTFRSERYAEHSRNPLVEFAGDLDTDLSRRDFTMNALAIGLPDGELVDPFGGLEDIEKGLIRTPLDPEIAFSDDPLRMLRAIRFVATLRFEVDPAVLDAIKRMQERMVIISRERIRDELTKLMLGEWASKALYLATETGLADQFLPELPALQLEQDPIHRHKDVFAHTLAVLDNVCAADAAEPDLGLRLGAVMHDIGKPRTRQITPNGVSFHHHEVVGADMAEARLRELHYPSKLVEEVKQLVYLHLRFHGFRRPSGPGQNGWTDRAVRRYVRDAGALLGKLNTLVRADCTTRNLARAKELSDRMDQLEAWIRDLASKEELSRMRPALDGREVMEHLAIPPGRMVGDALDFLMEIRMDEGEIPKEEAYQRLDEWISRQS